MLQSDLRYKFVVLIAARHAENAIETIESSICQVIFVGVSQATATAVGYASPGWFPGRILPHRILGGFWGESSVKDSGRFSGMHPGQDSYLEMFERILEGILRWIL